ncbi:MAG TPA: diguanylate cyclase [Rhizobacter sp.]|nr:diguanylate cyclase [Rhizobacter sp.]
METPRVASQRAAAASSEALPPQLAKAALRRLVMEKLEPTPDNYRRAYLQEAGAAAPPALPTGALPVVERLVARALAAGGESAQADLNSALLQGRWEQAERLLDAPVAASGASSAEANALAGLIERIVRGVQRGGRQWTTARKKDSLQRVLSSTRSDMQRLQQRLGQLVTGWESDTIEGAVDDDVLQAAAPDPWADPTQPAPLSHEPAPAAAQPGESIPLISLNADPLPGWRRLVASLGGTVQQALPPAPEPHAEMADELKLLTQRLSAEGSTAALQDEVEQLCQRASRVLQHRHYLIDQLGSLCQELTSSLVDLSEDESWAKGQCEAMQQEIEFGLTARSVRSVSEMLGKTREKQHKLRVERTQARDSLKALITKMLSELGELGSQTGRFHDKLGSYADIIEKADSLESLAGVVREMVEESRTVHTVVAQAQGRLQYEHSRATELSERVVELETELIRLSEEVSTDQLTKIANRRGLMQAFDAECARLERDGSELSVGLLDIDNFKRLNDELGHGVGDKALKALADVVSQTLRPTDLVARYGGEEFVVLLPNTPAAEGEQILTRLQRSLSGGLFMHEERQVFVTFSAGVTAYRPGERIEVALERADEALYEAKRTGKNKTCLS